jgi:hypothetical protein
VHDRCDQSSGGERKGSSPVGSGPKRGELSRRNNLLRQRFESRITVQRGEQWIYADVAHVKTISIAITLFQPIERFVVVA